MKKSNEILGLPVISITEGRELGMSKTLLIDARARKIAAITIEDEDWYRGVKLIPYDSVIAIGSDAVTVTSSESIIKLDEAADFENLLDENIRIIGTKAITKAGTIEGKVTEIYVGDDGTVERVEITGADGGVTEVNIDQISIFGKQVTVIDSNDLPEKKNSLIPPTSAAVPKAEPTFPKVELPGIDILPEEPVAEATVDIPLTEPTIGVSAVEKTAVDMPMVDAAEPLAEPVIDIPAVEPAAGMPAAEEPAIEMSTANVAEPVAEPVVDIPVVEPAVEIPAVEEPAIEIPTADVAEPVAEPVVDIPAVEPAVEIPAVEEPAIEIPTADVVEPVAEPVVDVPAVEPAVEIPTVEESVVDMPAVDVAEPAAEPVMDIPAVEPAMDIQTIEEPVVDIPTVDVAEPVAEPVADMPAVEETATPVVDIAKSAPEPKVEAPKVEAKPQGASTAKTQEDRHRRFMLGKKATKKIAMDNGIVIVEAGAEITEEVLQKAKLANKFTELAMNVQ